MHSRTEAMQVLAADLAGKLDDNASPHQVRELVQREAAILRREDQDELVILVGRILDAGDRDRVYVVTSATHAGVYRSIAGALDTFRDYYADGNEAERLEDTAALERAGIGQRVDLGQNTWVYVARVSA